MSSTWDPSSAGVPAQARELAAMCRVEGGCRGGRGRTGTAPASLVVLDDVDPRRAVTFVREHFHPGAVETTAQRRYVARFAAQRGRNPVPHHPVVERLRATRVGGTLAR